MEYKPIENFILSCGIKNNTSNLENQIPALIETMYKDIRSEYQEFALPVSVKDIGKDGYVFEWYVEGVGLDNLMLFHSNKNLEGIKTIKITDEIVEIHLNKDYDMSEMIAELDNRDYDGFRFYKGENDIDTDVDFISEEIMNLALTKKKIR